ncbi:MAG: hypothetical protein ABIJ34_00655 [archaeon]
MKCNKLKKFEHFRSRRFQKKAQLQLMENTFILIILFIIFAIAFVFVMVMQQAEQRDKISEFKDLEMMKKAQVLNFLPEMQCSDNNNLDPDCYDILKIESFTKYLGTDTLYYHSLLGNVKIKVVRYDPSPEVNKEIQSWEVYDFPKPDEKDMGYKEVQFPVLLKDVRESSSYFGIIYLGVYE